MSSFFLNIWAFFFFTLLTAQVLPTYHQDIKPILEKNCVICHQKKGNAPFALETFEQVKNNGKMIEIVSETGYMPPWRANPHFSRFANERLLSKEDQQKIADWVAAKMPQGKKQKAKVVLPKESEPKPDLVLKMPKAYAIAGDNKDKFICYKIPYELESKKYVKAIHFVPGNKKLVHHASYQVVEVGKNAPIFNEPFSFEYNMETFDHVDDNRDFKFLGLEDTLSGYMPKVRFHSGWLPGASPQKYPEGIGFVLPKRGVLLIRNLHYSATAFPANDQSEIHLWFSEKPVDRTVEFAAFKPRKFDPIIPKDCVKTYEMTLKIGNDMSLLHINPHMHKLGSYYRAFVLKPDGDTLPLIEIKHWDFNWQEFYRFRKITKVPAGSFLNIKATYDNTSKNKHNPNRPPIDVYFERGNMDDDREEMLRTSFIFLPYRQGDEDISLEF
ncbi:MAG: hypothetical protein SNJ77_11010 [Cytophagales bacterium]